MVPRLFFTFPLAAATIATPARADSEPELPRSVRLEYVLGPGAQSCPDSDMVYNAVLVQGRRDPFDANAGARLLIAIKRTGTQYEAHVEVLDEAGAVVWRREFQPLQSCKILAQDIGFVVGDRFRVAVGAASTPVRPPPSPPSTVPTSTRALPPAVSHSPSSRRVFVGGGVAMAIATAPSGVAPGLRADAGVRWPRISLAAEFRADLLGSASATRSSAPMTWRLGTSLMAGAAVACIHGSLAFGCGIVLGGALTGASSEIPNPVTMTTFYAAVGPRVGLEWPLPPWPRIALRASGEALWTGTTTTFLISKRQQWVTPPVSGVVGTGLVAFF